MANLEPQKIWARVMGPGTGIDALLTETATAAAQYHYLAEQCAGLDKKVLGKLEKMEREHLANLATLSYFIQGNCSEVQPILEEPTCLTIALRERYLSAQSRRNQLLQLANQFPALETRLLHMVQEQGWICDALLTLAKRRFDG